MIAFAASGSVAFLCRLLRSFPHRPSQDGCNALGAAAGGGHLAVLQLLLDLGADTNARDKVRGAEVARSAARHHFSAVQRG